MEKIALWGTIVNAFAVLIGTAIGLVLKKIIGTAEDKQERLSSASDFVFKGLGLCVFVIAVSGALESKKILVDIISVAIGGFIGSIIDVDKRIESLGGKLESVFGGKSQGSVSRGFVSATLLFCVGTMTLIGSMNSGLTGDHSMLYSKSVIDMFAAVILSLSLGAGVMLSALSVFVLQGSVALISYFAGNALSETVLTEAVICEMGAVGSIVLVGLALNMIGVTKLKVANFIPAVFLPIGLIPLFELLSF